ncbi:MAG: toprim domain-containing protein [Lysobacterales bacterium]
MRDAGIAPVDPGEIAADGALHRFNVEGDKPGRRNGWCVLHVDTRGAGGAFGSWRSGASHTWHSGGGRITASERKRLAEAIEQARCQREAETQRRHETTQARAQRLWAQAGPASADHPYLARKRVLPHGIRQSGELLLVPMHDIDNTLWNLQTIAADGQKRFLSGGRKRGLMFVIGSITGAAHVDTGDTLGDIRGLLIAEGYATAATLYECTDTPTVVAFDCGNLEPVASALRSKYPDVRVTLCADNDVQTPGNPGMAKATAAARAVGGFVAVPPNGHNDFNDAAVAEATP